VKAPSNRELAQAEADKRLWAWCVKNRLPIPRDLIERTRQRTKIWTGRVDRSLQ